MEQDFIGKVALITGAGSGMGAATARHLAARGAKVALAGFEPEGIARVRGEIEAAGGAAIDLIADVASPAAMQAAVEKTVAAYGALHFGVNNAGIACDYVLSGDLPPADWSKVISVNLDGVFHSLRYQVPAILAAGGGAIVNISSVFSQRGFGGRAAYAAAKHGVMGLTRSAALEYATSNIRVNSIAPGIIETPMLGGGNATAAQVAEATPMRRLGRPEEIATAVGFLLSDAASYVNGVTLPVDGGFLA